MRLPPDTVIAQEKMTKYLLRWRPENDKSQFLAQAGYTATHAIRLSDDLRTQLLPSEAEFEERTEYGDKWQITGKLIGPNGKTLKIRSIWITELATGVTKFVTLFPVKEN